MTYQLANYRNDGDNVRLNLAEADLDLTGSLVSALAGVMREDREAAPADLVARGEALRHRPDRLGDLLAAALPSAAAGPTMPKPKGLPRKGTQARAEHDRRQAMRRAALEELKAGSARREAEKVARNGAAGQSSADQGAD